MYICTHRTGVTAPIQKPKLSTTMTNYSTQIIADGLTTGFSMRAPNAAAASRLALQHLRRQIAQAKTGQGMLAMRRLISLEGQAITINTHSLYAEDTNELNATV